MPFKPPLSRAKRELRNLHSKHCRKVGLFIHRGVSLRSPVDKGTFRASWTLSQGKADTAVAAVGGVLGGPAITLPAKLPDFPILFINNQLPYGPRLEHGWSDQAPNGMVALTVQAAVEFSDSLGRAPGFA